MHERVVTSAVVLKTVDFGESDRVVTLFGRTTGKISAVARGARRSRKRFGAALGLFAIGEAVLRQRPGSSSELMWLESFSAQPGFHHLGLADDLAKVAHAGYVCELTSELVPAAHAEPAIFDQLLDMLHRLDTRAASVSLLRAFELQLLDKVGLRPQLGACLECGSPPEKVVTFDARRGGLLCTRCAPHGERVEPEVLETLLRLQDVSFDEADGLEMPLKVQQQLRHLTGRLVIEHVGRPLKSLEFLTKINQKSESLRVS